MAEDEFLTVAGIAVLLKLNKQDARGLRLELPLLTPPPVGPSAAELWADQRGGQP
jgi:hypothetical protein